MSGDVELAPLGKVVKPTRPRVKPSDHPDLPFIGMEHIEAQTMKLLGTVPASTMKSSAVHFKPGDVLYGRLRPYLNKVYGPSFEGLCSAEFIVLPENERIDGGYLKYFLNSSAFVRYASHLNAGDRPRVDFDQLAPYQIPLRPKQEQRRIVAEIEKQFSLLDEAVANLKRAKANLKRYKAAVLKAAVEGRLVPTEAELARREGRSYETGAQLLARILETRRKGWKGKGKYNEPAAPNTSDLPELPEGWAWSSVSQVADVASGNTPSGVLTAVRPAGEVPWFKVGDMNHIDNVDVMRHADGWLTHNQVKEFALRIFPPKTVLFPKRGGAIGTNKKRLVVRPCCADLNIMGITPAGEIADFFFAWFEGIDLEGLSDGSNVPQINHKDIDPLALPIPPLVEQQHIVSQVERCLSLVREVESQIDANFERSKRLRQTILASAFSGRLVGAVTADYVDRLQERVR